MIKIYETSPENKSYNYKGYTITDNGNWIIDDIGKEFATDSDAMDFIDNLTSDEEVKAAKALYQIPENQMTLGEIKKRYPNSIFEVYFLQYWHGGNLFAGAGGLCALSSDDLIIFKTAYDATTFNKQRGNIYVLTQSKLEDGIILYDFV